MLITFDTSSLADYQRFLAVKSLPRYAFRGAIAIVPDEYADRVGVQASAPIPEVAYTPSPWLFDYQRDIAALAIRKRKFACFAECGLGKTAIMLEFAAHAKASIGRRSVLIVTPLMVVRQTTDEAARFYGDRLPLQRIEARHLADWLENGHGIGVTNYDALTDDLPQGRLGALILDESSMLKSHYGKWGQAAIRLGKGLGWKLCLTGTPAPNDRIEYANHAVFLDQVPTINAFLARYFVNRGQTDNRWELKPHALAPFYRSLSHWCIFLSNPATYGWKDNATGIPPIIVTHHRVDMTEEQHALVQERTGSLFAENAGGITTRSKLAQIAKGHDGERSIDSRKPEFIRALVASWPDESTIVWCRYNREQDHLAAIMPDAASISGDTPEDERHRIIDGFKSGSIRVIITKPRILGFGLNLQRCTRQVFSSLQDSYEEFYQAVKRSNRVGSTKPLNVHIPYTDVEAPMIDTVLRKAARVQSDAAEQERIFTSANQ